MGYSAWIEAWMSLFCYSVPVLLFSIVQSVTCGLFYMDRGVDVPVYPCLPIRFHIDGMRQDGLPVPSPSSSVEYVEVAA